jgi:hypothetical protein
MRTMSAVPVPVFIRAEAVQAVVLLDQSDRRATDNFEKQPPQLKALYATKTRVPVHLLANQAYAT